MNSEVKLPEGEKTRFFGKDRIRRIVYTALLIALCAVLPWAFHMIPNFGTLFSPMHLPVLLCGLICGPVCGLLCGIGGPLLSSLCTGMPPMAMLPLMMVECAVYGLMSGLFMKLIRTKFLYIDLYASLLIAQVVGRIVAGLARAVVFFPGTVTISSFLTAYFASTLPGIIVQLVLIPSIVFALMRARLLPTRVCFRRKKQDLTA